MPYLLSIQACGSHKIGVIKAIRDAGQCSLKDAKDCSEGHLLLKVSDENVGTLHQALIDLGAVCKLVRTEAELSPYQAAQLYVAAKMWKNSTDPKTSEEKNLWDLVTALEATLFTPQPPRDRLSAYDRILKGL